MVIFCWRTAYLYLTATMAKATLCCSRCNRWMILESLLILHLISPYVTLTHAPGASILAQNWRLLENLFVPWMRYELTVSFFIYAQYELWSSVWKAFHVRRAAELFEKIRLSWVAFFKFPWPWFVVIFGEFLRWWSFWEVTYTATSLHILVSY